MIITIRRHNADLVSADIQDLPGSPYLGMGTTKEEAIANVFINNRWSIGRNVDDQMFYSLSINDETRVEHL